MGSLSDGPIHQYFPSSFCQRYLNSVPEAAALCQTGLSKLAERVKVPVISKGPSSDQSTCKTSKLWNVSRGSGFLISCTLYRFTIAGRKIQGTQVQKANTPSTQQQKHVGGQQSFKENRNMGNVKSQGQTTHAPKFHPKANVAMGAKTSSKAKESATPPPKNPKNNKFTGTIMVLEEFEGSVIVIFDLSKR